MDPSPYVPGYVLEQRLGAGGHGVVWTAREKSSGQVVVVKIVPLRAPEHRAQVQRDAALLASIDHPHLLPFYGGIEIEDGVALVMAVAQGGSLADLLATRGVLTPGEVVTICAPLAEALGEVHRRGMVHGDVQPANVLFTADGRPMLSDLGIARFAMEQPTVAGVKPGFSSPEVEAGQGPTPASDVYGIAATAMVALTGHLPGTPLTLPGIAPATYGALTQALQPDPGRRPGAGSLVDAFFALADPEPVALGPRSEEFAALGADVLDEPDQRSRSVEVHEADENAGPPRRRARREVTPSGRARRRKRDILVWLAVLVTVPVVALGAYAVWNQLTGSDDDSLVPSAGRVTASADAEGEQDLCGGPQPAPTETPPEVTDWTPVVEGLLALRATAFNERDPELLCQLFAPTSPYLASDYALLQEYIDQDFRTSGLRYDLIDVEPVSEDGEIPVVLEITDRVAPHELIDADGAVVAQLDGLPEDTWTAELVVSSDASGWRFS